jgi:tetratricopeptide (TPR) repeat protein/TolB-like protein
MLRTTAIFLVLLAALSAPATAQSGRVMVAPFEDRSGDPRLHWLAEASVVLVVDALRQADLPVVPRADRVRAYDDLNVPLSATLSRATVIKIAELLGAQEIVTGSFTVAAGQLTVTATRIRLDSGRSGPQVSEHGPLTSMYEVYDRVARGLTGRSQAAAPAGRPPLGAFESYVKGLVAESLATRASFLESALEEAPAFDRARLALWDVRTEQGDFDAALAAVSPVEEDSRDAYPARFRAALSLLQLERYDDAFDAFTGLLTDATLPVRAAAIQNNLAIIQMRRGARSEGGSPQFFLTRAADADPADSNYRFNLGYVYAKNRDPQAAIYWLREVLRRDPADADAHLVLAVALQDSGATVEAARERDLAHRLSSDYEDLDKGARAALPKGLERLQLEPDGSYALRAGQIVLASVQREQQQAATFHLERGQRLFDREQDSEALAELRRAVYLSPYEATAHLLMGRIYLRGGRTDDAIAALKISVWSADTAAARIALAEAYLKSGDQDSARGELTRALELQPDDAEAKRLLGDIK